MRNASKLSWAICFKRNITLDTLNNAERETIQEANHWVNKKMLLDIPRQKEKKKKIKSIPLKQTDI